VFILVLKKNGKPNIDTFMYLLGHMAEDPAALAPNTIPNLLEDMVKYRIIYDKKELTVVLKDILNKLQDVATRAAIEKKLLLNLD